ncbi:NADH:ubiquinone oxidoreductase subunit 3 (subunit A) [Bacilli bacterium PM5-3]|nr:NADH:ubiquinone oxidoreductase subunit 3 (subunit A) [Bacilli bacterium PM5-3]MDH6603294.1 NADH:ubiquinone oxidoreductase subunit 3 (subunit A) [Bacilli bacterium PM5-9]
MNRIKKLLALGVLCIIAGVLLYFYQDSLDYANVDLVNNNIIDGMSAVEAAKTFSNNNQSELTFYIISIFFLVFGVILTSYSSFTLYKKVRR